MLAYAVLSQVILGSYMLYYPNLLVILVFCMDGIGRTETWPVKHRLRLEIIAVISGSSDDV